MLFPFYAKKITKLLPMQPHYKGMGKLLQTSQHHWSWLFEILDHHKYLSQQDSYYMTFEIQITAFDLLKKS